MATVLVVDDNEVARRVAGECVEREGFRPLYANHGRDAVRVLERETPDIVLTDLLMPDMDGLQLVEHVRENHPMVPVILMTAHGSEETVVTALRAGAASYVAKHQLKQQLKV